jgi:hypothetical protein
MSTPKLFTPIQVGNLTLQHRIVLSPLTRFRARENHVHNKFAVDYYRQRASVRGTLLITEATFVAPQAGGLNNVPGIWNDEQIAAWKEVGCHINLLAYAGLSFYRYLDSVLSPRQRIFHLHANLGSRSSSSSIGIRG